jgi:hypothetical protein
MSLGTSTNGFLLYWNEANQRIESSHYLASSPTGGSSLWAMDTNWHLIAFRYSTSTGWQINTDGVDRGSRINPSKWANSVITAQLRPGTFGTNAHWQGALADLAFFDYEVTAQNLLDVYTAGTTAPAVDTVDLPPMVLQGGVWVEV